MNDKLIPRREVLETLKIHYQTLNNMVKRKEIEVVKIGTKYVYNLDKYLRVHGIQKLNKKKLCYCRVSSYKQKEDLDRQIKYMSDKFPTYELIKDIGSSLNFERQGLQKILDYAIKGEVEELVIAYKDRLARIGYELIELMITKYSNGKIIILEKSEEETPDEELVKDILSIMNVYVAKINGLRKYKTLIKKEIMDKQPKK
ncbi:resolvase [Klosneuvirus KNV1]|uniref:Resolvase n=1 Tax=Klosneuvirus KNV1 TaxID=1977640 RepID=A0A1V0SL24_9VIRU|nr:resolvase [Klosneuvirus KNV1]